MEAAKSSFFDSRDGVGVKGGPLRKKELIFNFEKKVLVQEARTQRLRVSIGTDISLKKKSKYRYSGINFGIKDIRFLIPMEILLIPTHPTMNFVLK